MEAIIEQAGAVTFQKVNNSFEILLVRSKKEPQKWIFPKGHIESGESALNAAERELLEEAGVEGFIQSKVGNIEYETSNHKYNVTYYICQFVSDRHSGESGREPTWYEYNLALKQLSYSELVTLLKSAAVVIKQLLK